MTRDPQKLLMVQNLGIGTKDGNGLVKGVSFSLHTGEIFGIAGESGSGKTLTAMAVCGLLPPSLEITGGRVLFENHPLVLKKGRFEGIRLGRDIMMLFQSPYAALDPTSPAGDQISLALKANLGLSKKACRSATGDLMEMVGLSRDCYSMYPFQLSGGQRQRVILAMAFGIKPRILFADEPTSGLDDHNRDHILDLFTRLQKEAGISVVLISHDLRIIRNLAEYMTVIYRGKQVESGKVSKILSRPAHPHSTQLVEALRFLSRGETV